MATYTKETALYDTGAIAGDIQEAGTTATNYISTVSNDGIFVHQTDSGKDGTTPTASTAYGVHISDDIDIIQGGVSVASYGAEARIGTVDDANITIDGNSISGVGASGKEFFVFEDSLVRIATEKSSTLCSTRPLNYFPYGSGGITYTLHETPSSGTNIKLLITITDGSVVKKRGELVWPVGTSGSSSVNLSITGYPYGTLSATYNGSNTFSNVRLSARYTTDTTTNIRITVSYKIVDLAPAYKIGSGHTVTGAYAYAEGFGNTAAGNYSHAEGSDTIAWAPNSHAEGLSTTAGKYEDNVTSGSYAHAEGAHTIASGAYGHAEGGYTKAIGDYSHAQNRGTLASSYAQTAIGEYNIEDTNDTYAFIVGNGDGNNARSNALTIDWDGNVNAGGKYESLFKITEVTKTISGGINANSYVAAANISMTAQTGYNAVGIVGHSSSNFRVQPTTNYVSSNTAIFAGFANWSASNVTSNVTVVFYVLWLKATSA